MSDDPEVEKYRQVRQRERDREDQIEGLQRKIGEVTIAVLKAQKAGDQALAEQLEERLSALDADLDKIWLSI